MNYEDRVTKEYIESALAGAGVKLVAGTYEGDLTETRFIEIGFTPKLVYVCTAAGETVNGGTIKSHWGGLALPNKPVVCPGNYSLVEVTTGGFIVHYKDTAGSTSGYNYRSNYYGEYHYFAIG